MSQERLLHPVSGQHSFGIVPACKSRGILFPRGDIYLPIGRHKGPNSGFGARHIWEEHKKEILAAGFSGEADVPAFVARIVRSGTPLLFEGGIVRTNRLLAVRGPSGMAVLEQRGTFDDAFWSIVTTYVANKKHGTRVGTVL